MKSLSELWAWAYEEGRAAEYDPPDRIHAHYPYAEKDSDLPDAPWDIERPTVQKTRSAGIVGPPFTRAFVRYLDGGRAMTPIRRALIDMRPRRSRAQTLEFRIVWGVVEAGHDLGTLQAIERCGSEMFHAAALRGLAYLYDKTQKEIAYEPKRLALTPSVGVVTVGGGVQGAPKRPQVGTSRRRRPDSERAAS